MENLAISIEGVLPLLRNSGSGRLAIVGSSAAYTAKEQTTLTYNMNILQRLSKKHTYLVTLNQEIAKEHVLREFTYHHPIFSLEAVKAQAGWEIISGKNRSHYCGAYWFNGFHEDGVKSGLRVKNAIEEIL